MFKTPAFVKLTAAAKLKRVTTHFYFFGALLQKPTHLLGNLPGLENLGRTFTAKDKKKLAERLAKLKNKPCYYHLSKNGNVSGGKDLHKTAAYPKKFGQALLRQWQLARHSA